ncbi:MAG TPA: protein kinase [Kofleriaceae bacterium]|jgi:serine/threonine-protein kinase|nr:protein kinase [Kofleriaceae bacterium]
MELVGTNIGPFRIVRVLGKGGMGSVYLAEHTLMKDLHAIKVLDPVLTQNPQLIARFINEARAAAHVRHRNLVRVHNIERIPGGPWFMVLDFLAGQTLGQFLTAQRGPLSPPTIVHILAQVANCIQHTHDHGIVHRDLKPDNIFLIRHGDDPLFPVVLDLGIAQLGGDLASGPPTCAGMLIGTPSYMAPEQLRGERVTPAADVFALGVIAYELTTGGWFPYQHGEARATYFELPATELHHRVCDGPPRDPRLRVPGLPAVWAEAVSRALARDPGARPPSARAFALMLAEAVTAGPEGVDGHAIVCRVARELLAGSGDDAIQPNSPTALLTSTAEPEPPAPVARAEPTTTLGGTASQSMVRLRARLRWSTITASAAAALVASAASMFALTRLVAPQGIPPTTTVATSTPPPPLSPAAKPIAGDPAPREVTPPSKPPVHPAPTTPAVTPAPATPPAPPSTTQVRAPSPTPVTKKGELAILVRPWAMIWLNGRELGQTPYRDTIAAGRYRVRLVNEDLGIDETTTVTVVPDRPTTIERSWKADR